MKTAIFIRLLGAGLVLAGISNVALSQELEKLNVIVPNERTAVQYEVFVARDLGFYEDEGLDVTFLSSATTVPYVAFLQNGDADIAMMDSSEILQALNAGLPVSVIYETQQVSPDGIVVPFDSDITSLAALEGKTIGMASDRDLVTTAISFQKVGLSIDNVRTVVVGDEPPIIVSSFRNGQIDAFAGGTSDRFGMEAAGIPFRDITPAAAQENPANSHVIWGPRKEELSGRIAKFLRAWAKAQHAAMVDFDVVASICRENVPEQWENIQLGRKLLDFTTYKLNVPRATLRGRARPELWVEVQQPLIDMGQLEKAFDPSDFIDVSFVEAANDYTYADVREAVKAWRAENPDKMIP